LATPSRALGRPGHRAALHSDRHRARHRDRDGRSRLLLSRYRFLLQSTVSGQDLPVVQGIALVLATVGVAAWAGHANRMNTAARAACQTDWISRSKVGRWMNSRTIGPAIGSSCPAAPLDRGGHVGVRRFRSGKADAGTCSPSAYPGSHHRRQQPLSDLCERARRGQNSAFCQAEDHHQLVADTPAAAGIGDPGQHGQQARCVSPGMPARSASRPKTGSAGDVEPGMLSPLISPRISTAAAVRHCWAARAGQSHQLRAHGLPGGRIRAVAGRGAGSGRSCTWPGCSPRQGRQPRSWPGAATAQICACHQTPWTPRQGSRERSISLAR